MKFVNDGLMPLDRVVHFGWSGIGRSKVRMSGRVGHAICGRGKVLVWHSGVGGMLRRHLMSVRRVHGGSDAHGYAFGIEVAIVCIGEYGVRVGVAGRNRRHGGNRH